MKIIDGKNAVLGRLASYIAKESLKGEEIILLNCEKMIITGNRKSIEKDFEEKRSRVGSSQKGPKYGKTVEKIIKRSIRGMLPNHRKGKGKIAFKKIKCYADIPKEFQDIKKISFNENKKNKYILVEQISKNK